MICKFDTKKPQWQKGVDKPEWDALRTLPLTLTGHWKAQPALAQEKVPYVPRASGFSQMERSSFWCPGILRREHKEAGFREQIFTQWEMTVTPGNGLSRQHLKAFQKEHECIIMAVTAFFKDVHRVLTNRKGQDGVGCRGSREGFYLASSSYAIPIPAWQNLHRNDSTVEILGMDKCLQGFQNRVNLLQEYIYYQVAVFNLWKVKSFIGC